MLCACGQVQSTVWCSFHTAARNHLTTGLFVAFLCFFLFLFVVVVVVATPVFFVNLVVAQNHQIGVVYDGVFMFFRGHSEHNKIANTDAFGASEAQNRSIYFFLASGSKNHGFYNFDQCLAKTLVFTCLYAVFSMLQEVLFPCQRHKNIVNWSFWLLARA